MQSAKDEVCAGRTQVFAERGPSLPQHVRVYLRIDRIGRAPGFVAAAGRGPRLSVASEDVRGFPQVSVSYRLGYRKVTLEFG
jgi:hypothetical protein